MRTIGKNTWRLIIMTWLMFVLISGCKTTKQVNREEFTVDQQTESNEIVNISKFQETETLSCVMAETVITEIIDTVIKLYPVINGVSAIEPVLAVVKQKKITHRKEAADQHLQGRKQTTESLTLSVQDNISSKVAKEERQVTRIIFPGWLAVLLTVIFLFVGFWIIHSKHR